MRWFFFVRSAGSVSCLHVFSVYVSAELQSCAQIEKFWIVPGFNPFYPPLCMNLPLLSVRYLWRSSDCSPSYKE